MRSTIKVFVKTELRKRDTLRSKGPRETTPITPVEAKETSDASVPKVQSTTEEASEDSKNGTEVEAQNNVESSVVQGDDKESSVTAGADERVSGDAVSSCPCSLGTGSYNLTAARILPNLLKLLQRTDKINSLSSRKTISSTAKATASSKNRRKPSTRTWAVMLSKARMPPVAPASTHQMDRLPI